MIAPILEQIGHKKLRELSAADVRAALSKMAATYSSSSVTMGHLALKRTIRHAEASDRVGRNVALLVDTPKGQEGRPSKSLNLEQAVAIIAASQSLPELELRPGLKDVRRPPELMYAYVVLCLLVGVRTEEARALRWDAVQLKPEEGTPPHVAVLRSVRLHGETKTVKSRRTLGLPRTAVEALLALQKSQEAERAQAGDKWQDTGLVFTTHFGAALDAANVRKMFRRVCKEAGVGEHWTPRELRHSFVSLLSDSDVPIEKIAMLVGHSNSRTTGTVYRHVLRPVITTGAEVMDECR